MNDFETEVNRLLDGVKADDKKSLILLFDLTSGPLSSTINKHVKSAYNRDAAMTEIYERALLNIDHYHSGEDAYRWLERIALITALYYKERETKALSKKSPEELKQLQAERESTAKRCSLASAVRKMTYKDKFVAFSIFYFANTYEEIAKETGVNLATIYKRVKRIISIIKAKCGL